MLRRGLPSIARCPVFAVAHNTYTMARTASTVIVLLAAIIAGIYQLYFRHNLALFGLGRVIEHIGNADCVVTAPELQACESGSLLAHDAFPLISLRRDRLAPVYGCPVLGVLYTL
jgi:hypothetical protein